MNITTVSPTIDNGVENAVAFDFEGLRLSHHRQHHDRIVRTIKAFSGFIKIPDRDGMEINWDLYSRVDEDGRENLNLVLHALGVFTDTRRPGCVRIVGTAPGDENLMWGPTLRSEELVFSKDYWFEAENFVRAQKKICARQGEEIPSLRTEKIR